jgi:hypothetical protein
LNNIFCHSNNIPFTLPYRWFLEIDQSNQDAVLLLLELTFANADKLLKGKVFSSKSWWKQIQNPLPNPKSPETHLYFQRLPKAIGIGNSRKDKGCLDPVCPKMIELDTAEGRQQYAMVLISGLSRTAKEKCCAQRCKTGFQEILSTQYCQKLKLAQAIHSLCGIWHSRGNYLDSKEALDLFRLSNSSLQNMVDIFTRQPIDLQMAAQRLTVLLALICSIDRENIERLQPLSQMMATAAEYAVQCCREEVITICMNLMDWLNQTTTRFVSGGLICANDRLGKDWLCLTGNMGLDRAESLGEIASIWDEFSSQKQKPPSKIILLLQHCLENRTLSSQLNEDDREYCSAELIRIQSIWSCVDSLCKTFSKCTFSGNYLYREIFTPLEQILACRHAVQIEKAILKCISSSGWHIGLRQALSNLFCIHQHCLPYMQVVYAEVYTIEYAGISAKLVVTASNIHKWFPFLETHEFIQCLDAETTTQHFLGSKSDRVLCLHLGDSHEMGLISSYGNSNATINIGNMNRSCLRCLDKLKKSVQKFIREHSARKDVNSWICDDDDTGVRISQLQNLVVYACLRRKRKLRCKITNQFYTELNSTFRVNNELLWQNLDKYQDVDCCEHSKFFHSPESIWRLSGPDSGNIERQDKVQAALDIYSNFPGLDVEKRLTLLYKKTQAEMHLTSRDILLSRHGELHSHVNQDALERIYNEIQVSNSKALEGQYKKPKSDKNEVLASKANFLERKSNKHQNEVDGAMELEDHDEFMSDLVHSSRTSPKLNPHALLQDSDRVSDIKMLLNSPDHQLMETPNPKLEHTPDKVKFSRKGKTKNTCIQELQVSRKLFGQQAKTIDFREQYTMNRDEYHHSCRMSGMLRRIQISRFNPQEIDCQTLSVEAVLPNPNPNILMPIIVLIAQIHAEGRTSLYSSCGCSQCITSDFLSETQTVVFFHSIKVLHLSPLCPCVDAMQHILKQCLGMFSFPLNQFCAEAGDSDAELKIESSYCCIYQENESRDEDLVDPKMQVVLIPIASDVFKSKCRTILSVIIEKKASHEVSHSLVYVGSVQKQRLLEMCRRKNLPPTQLFCLKCQNSYISRTGYRCLHNKAAHHFLHPQSSQVGSSAQSEISELEGDDSDELHSSDEEIFFNDLDQNAPETFQNDNGSHKKMALPRLEKEQEHFDSQKAWNETGYVFIPTLSSKQGAKVEVDITYGNSPETNAAVEKQKYWTSIEYLIGDKTLFDLCKIEKFQHEFLPSDTCAYCSHERIQELEPLYVSPAKVYLSNCQICSVPAKFWHCKSCNNSNHYDGRKDGLWFYSKKIAFSLVLILRQLKGFVSGTITTFSSFVSIHDLVTKSAMFNAPVEFTCDKIWRITCFSAWSTYPDLRFPCSLCLLAANGRKPADFKGKTLTDYKKSAPLHVWDPSCLIQDAIANFVECRERPDLGAGTIQSYPVEQESSILDRCPIPTGGFITLPGGKVVYKNALNATSEQRRDRATLREMFKSVGKNIHELCHEVSVDFSTYAIENISQMKRLLRSAWHAKQKETDADHPFSLLLDMLHAQQFPSVWSYPEKTKFMYTCGVLCQQIGAQASVFTLIKDWVVSKILKFCSCMSDMYVKFDIFAQEHQLDFVLSLQSDTLIHDDMQLLLNIRKELLDSLAPNADSIPADPNIFELLRFTSADVDNFHSYRSVNLAISSALKYLAYCACEISSRHKIMIDGCESTGIFNLATDTKRYHPIRSLRSYLSKDDNLNGGVDAETSEAGTENLKLPDYNPVKFNCALYFSPEAAQIRRVPYTGVVIGDRQDGDCRKPSYKVDASLGRLKNTDMLSVFQCGYHPGGGVVGYSIIFQGEGRKDSHFPVAAFKPTPPAVFIYDHACG